MHQMLIGFAEVLSPASAGWCLLGTVLGIVVGAIPGLTGAMLIALTLPLTYYMDAVPSVVLLIGMYVGSISGGLITATLLRMPGTPSNIMTTFDGYPMARDGKPGRALGLGITASFVGGLLSWVVLVLLAKPLSIWATRFGPFEIFSLILMAMVLIASVSQGSLLKGLISGVLGMLLSMPGVDPSAGQPRLTFGLTDLNGGLKLLPVLIGVFAVSQIISDILNMDARVDSVQASRSGMMLRFKRLAPAWHQHGALVGHRHLRRHSAGNRRLDRLGNGLHGGRNMSKTPERFGQGAEEGIIASEAANNATIGGALVPLIAMGIPGSVIDAILIGGLMIHDIQPGPTLFMIHSDVVWAMIAACFVANVMMFVVMMPVGGCRRAHRFPAEDETAAGRSWCSASSAPLPWTTPMFDVWVMLGCGLLGYALERAKYPLGPFVIGFVLAPLMEQKLRSGLMMSAGSLAPIVERPISLVFFLCAVALLVWPALSAWRKRLRAARTAEMEKARHAEMQEWQI